MELESSGELGGFPSMLASKLIQPHAGQLLRIQDHCGPVSTIKHRTEVVNNGYDIKP